MTYRAPNREGVLLGPLRSKQASCIEQVAQACAGTNYLAGVWFLENRFHVESCRLWAIKKKDGERREEEWGGSERCLRARLLSINSRLRLRLYVGRCRYPTRSLYGATYSNVPWCLVVEAYLFRANAMIRRTTSNRNLLVRIYVCGMRNYVTTAILVIGQPYWYLIPPHICYQHSCVRVTWIPGIVGRSTAQRWQLCLCFSSSTYWYWALTRWSAVLVTAVVATQHSSRQ